MESRYSNAAKSVNPALNVAPETWRNMRIGYFDDRISRLTEYGILAFVILAALFGNYLSDCNLMKEVIVL